jgi:hypothetical protein
MIDLILWLLFGAILGCLSWANGDALAKIPPALWRNLRARVQILGQFIYLWRRYGCSLAWRLTCEARRRVSK